MFVVAWSHVLCRSNKVGSVYSTDNMALDLMCNISNNSPELGRIDTDDIQNAPNWPEQYYMYSVIMSRSWKLPMAGAPCDWPGLPQHHRPHLSYLSSRQATMPICIECSYPVSHLYSAYSRADDRSQGKGVRLTQCPRCQRFADKYIEYDFVVIFIDLVLIKPQVLWPRTIQSLS